MQENFLTKISHEIRTPINAIIGLGFLFQQTRLDDQQRKYLSTIIDSAQNLLHIFQSILDYTTSEDGSLELQPLPFQLTTLLDNISNAVKLRCQEKGLAFNLTTSNDVPPMLLGDPIRISQVLLNIANNAVKFTASGSVQIHIEMVENSNHLVRFSVTDTGIGIPEECREKIFLPFVQADNSHTRLYGGAGLGLATCAQIIKCMHGTINVKDNQQSPQGGSTFIVEIPLPQAEGSALFHDEGPLQNKRVLIVDNKALRQQVLINTMEGFEMRVESTHDAEQAIKLIAGADGEDNPFDFVLMAWQSLGMDSMEVVEQLNKLPLDHPVPLALLISDYQLDEVRGLALESGFFEVIQTPASALTFYEPMLKAYEDRNEKLAAEAAAKEAEEAAATQGEVCILLVEDNEINQEIAYEVLTSAEYKVDIANNGQEAVDAVNKKKYSLVLMDIQMPVLDGLEATKQIRADGHKLPIIAMTAHGMADDKETSIAAGMNAHLTKPLEPMALFATITSLLPAAPKAPAVKTEADKEIQFERREKLPQNLKGFNLEKGLAAVAGNEALYINLLRKFADRYATINKDISDCIQQNDLDTAVRHAHTIRGIAANLGATALSTAAEALEKAIKNAPAMTSPLLRTLVVRLTEAVNSIHDCFGSSHTSVESRIDASIEDRFNMAEREHARHVLDQAILHMEEDWSHATTTVAYLLERLEHTPAEPDLLHLKQCIEDFEVESAQKYSKSVQKLLKTS